MLIMKQFVCVFVFLNLVLVWDGVQALAFDCSKAKTGVEVTICGSEELKILDKQLNEAFSKKSTKLNDAEKKQLISDQRVWLKSRDSCPKGDIACISLKMNERLKILGKGPAVAKDIGKNNVRSQTLRQELLKQDTTLKDVEIISCKADPALFIAILVTEYDWWESIHVVKFENRKIIWSAKFDMLAQSILSARQISLKGISNPLIEVFDETHMGNGSYDLYELIEQKLKLLVSTVAVDNHEDEAIEINDKYYSRLFKNGQLKPVYEDINKDGFTDIKLVGIIQIVGDNYSKEYSAQKIFLYDKTKKKFVEDLKQRKGFKPNDD